MGDGVDEDLLQSLDNGLSAFFVHDDGEQFPIVMENRPTVSAESYAVRFAVVITGSPHMPDQPASERARVMHLLADARERMLREGVAREDDEAVDWGDLLAACKGEAESMQTPCTKLADRQVI